MTRPIVFVWRRKLGARRTASMHALYPTATATAMCGTSTAKDTHWAEPYEEQHQCRKCIEAIVLNYPSSMPGVAELAGAIDVGPADAYYILQRMAEHSDRAVAILGTIGYRVDPADAEIVVQAFVAYAKHSQKVG